MTDDPKLEQACELLVAKTKAEDYEREWSACSRYCARLQTRIQELEASLSQQQQRAVPEGQGMDIELIHGRYLVCRHILSEKFILPGQLWASADGSDREVEVSSVENGVVYYFWYEGEEYKEHKKLAFAFQCRYCLVIDKEVEV